MSTEAQPSFCWSAPFGCTGLSMTKAQGKPRARLGHICLLGIGPSSCPGQIHEHKSECLSGTSAWARAWQRCLPGQASVCTLSYPI